MVGHKKHRCTRIDPLKLQSGPRIYWKQNSGNFLKEKKKEKKKAGMHPVIGSLLSVSVFKHSISSHVLHPDQQISSEVPFQALPCQSP